MAVEIKTDAGGVHAGTPRVLFELRVSNLPGPPYYDVSRDGQRFLINVAGEETTPTPMAVVRQLIRRGLKDLTVVDSGFSLDLLIAAGCARKVVSYYAGGGFGTPVTPAGGPSA